MDPRYRYSGRHSPTLYNQGRTSLPLNLLHPEQNHHHHHLHAVPTARREVIPISVSQPRSSSERINVGGPVTTTTYKIKADPPRSSSGRDVSRARRATLDSQTVPNVITSIASPARHRPVVHGNGNGRASPVHNPYRSSGEDQYYAVPATSGKHRHHHSSRYSIAMDDADMTRLAREHEPSNRLAVDRSREGQTYTATPRSRPTYTAAVVRHPDTVADDYGDDGYGYTTPKELVQYDLSTSGRRQRRESFEGGRGRASSTQNYDQGVRSHDNRERGPPPSTRGFAQVNSRTWPTEPQPVPPRLTIPPPPPMDPIQRPASARPVESIQRPARIESYEDSLAAGGLQRRSSDRRPVSIYQDRERRPHKDDTRDYYGARDDDLRRERKHRREPSWDDVGQRGFGVRQERVERDDRTAIPRAERPEKVERVERVERPEHKSGRDTITAGLSTAAAALGIGAIAKKSSRDEGRDDREDRDDQRARREEREEREEQRRRRDREERDAMDREARHREEREDRSLKTPRDEGFQDVRQAQRHNSRDERDLREDESRRLRLEPSMSGAGLKPREDSPGSDEAARSRKPRSRRQSGAAGTFNPRDALDLRALKDELARTAPPVPPKEPLDSPVNLPQSRDIEKTELRDDRGRLGPLAPAANDRQLRVVSPPRDQAPPAEKPVKGILRQPREKFPEDPAPIREGVAPLKDSKKDGIPPDARWTKISRKLVNPGALEAGKERYETRDDFVIVLRVLTREEVQAYAIATQQIRAAREEAEEAQEREERRRARRERHERHKRERENHGRGESTHRSRRHRHGDAPSDSQSDETTDEDQRPRVKLLESAPRGVGGIPGQVAGTSMSGGLGDAMPTSNRRRDD